MGREEKESRQQRPSVEQQKGSKGRAGNSAEEVEVEEEIQLCSESDHRAPGVTRAMWDSILTQAESHEKGLKRGVTRSGL